MTFEVLFAAWLLGAVAQQPVPAIPLEVHIEVPEGRFIRPDQGVDVRLSRPLTDGDGRLAIVIGSVDWTSLFAMDGPVFGYHQGPVPLPQGETPVIVYLVTPANRWRQIGAFTLRVTTPGGFEHAKVAPAADMNNLGQEAENHEPAANAPPRHSFQDFTSHLGLTTEHVRDGVTLATQTNLLGASNETQALRFAQIGKRAAQIDLSDYVWSVAGRRMQLAFGSTTLNAERHLGANFRTRGVTVKFTVAPLDVTLAAVNGQSIVGFDNFLGVSSRNNRVSLAVIGGELLPRRRGAARIEVALVDGERQARAGATQGQVTDIVKSRGGALRFLGSDPTRRFRIDTGFARSRSTNPDDPLLSQGLTIVPVRARTSNAEYVDGDYDVLHGTTIGRQPVTLTGSYRFERVDPFFTSVAALQGVRSDVLQHTASVNGSVGRITAQVSDVLSHDNLGKVASILRTNTGLTTASVTVPTGAFGQSPASQPWWPLVSYALNRSSQIGASEPQHGGFVSPSQVPNQLNTLHTLGANWTFRRWRAGYAMNHAFQDNRQPGRETSDFANLTQQITLGVTPRAGLDLALTGGRDRATNFELQKISRTTRAGGTITWQIDTPHAISAIVNRTAIRDAAAGPSTVTDINFQYSYSFAFGSSGPTRPHLQLFARWTWQSSNALDLLLGAVNDRRNWSLSSGATITVF